MYFRLAWRNLWRNRRRTFITTASIFFAVLLAIVMRSMQRGSYDRMIDNIVGFYTGYAQIHRAGYWDEQSLDNSFLLTDSLTASAKLSEGVNEVIPRLESFVLISSGNRTRGILIVGIEPELERQLTDIPSKMIAGSYVERQDKALLLTSELAAYLDAGVGDTMVLLGQGYHGASAAAKYVVKGIVKFNSPELNKRTAFLPLAEAQYLFDAQDRATALVVMTEADKVKKVVRKLERQLGDDFEVRDWKTMLPEMVQAMEADSVGNMIVRFILYIVVGFGIFGTVLMMTAERRHEFGVLVALGMKRRRLLAMLSLESIFMTMLGVVAGMMVSLPVLIYFYFNPIKLSKELKQVSEAYGFEALLPFSIAPSVFYEQALAVLAISIVAMFYPLLKLLFLNATQAMRS